MLTTDGIRQLKVSCKKLPLLQEMEDGGTVLSEPVFHLNAPMVFLLSWHGNVSEMRKSQYLGYCFSFEHLRPVI